MLPGVDIEAFKVAMGTFPTGVAVVTAMDGDDPVGFSCQSIVSLSLEPPLVALAPGKASTSWPRIARAGSFCVNVLSSRQDALARSFARSGGYKFASVSWRTALTGAPLIDGALAHVECRLELAHDAGDHEIVIGRVLGVETNGVHGPLVFFRSGFYRLEPEPLSGPAPPELLG